MHQYLQIVDLGSLKSEVGKLDTNELKTVPEMI